MIRFLKHWWPSGLCLLVILYATLTPAAELDVDLPAFPHVDKLIHAIMMGGLTGALAFDYARVRSRRPLTRAVLMAIAGGVAGFSLVDEWLQSAVTPDRSGDPLDLCADLAGILVALLTAPPLIRHILRRQRPI